MLYASISAVSGFFVSLGSLLFFIETSSFSLELYLWTFSRADMSWNSSRDFRALLHSWLEVPPSRATLNYIVCLGLFEPHKEHEFKLKIVGGPACDYKFSRDLFFLLTSSSEEAGFLSGLVCRVRFACHSFLRSGCLPSGLQLWRGLLVDPPLEWSPAFISRSLHLTQLQRQEVKAPRLTSFQRFIIYLLSYQLSSA